MRDLSHNFSRLNKYKSARFQPDITLFLWKIASVHKNTQFLLHCKSPFSTLKVIVVDLVLCVNSLPRSIILVNLHFLRFRFQSLKPVKLVEDDWQERCNQ